MGCFERGFIQAGEDRIVSAGNVWYWRTVLSYDGTRRKQFVSLRGRKYMVASIGSGGEFPQGFR
jgi:hypothetical protein